MSSEMSYDHDHAETEVSSRSQAGYGEVSRPQVEKRKKPEQGRRRGKSPSSFNGMHRRRRRKMAW